METLLDIYNKHVRDGLISMDTAQLDILRHLERIRDAVEHPPKRGFFRKPPPPPKGLYLWGGVGCGKSMVMDMFVDALSVPVRRVHFHAFMQEIQNELHIARKNGVEDAIKPLAKKISDSLRVLAFDEMQIKDIADAMIVGRLFDALFADGVVVITTSNRPPDDLYKDGLNRQLFLPFIDLINQKLQIIEIDSQTDYRQNRLSGEQVYFTPLGISSTKHIDLIWNDLTGGQIRDFSIFFKGRKIDFPKYFDGVGRFSFFDLCGQPMGPGDYLAIVDTLRVLVVDDIPRLGRSNFNEAKRFVTLIDAVYEAGIKFVCSAAAQPDMLYIEGEGSFEFERTASRLMEMQSAQWGVSPHFDTPV